MFCRAHKSLDEQIICNRSVCGEFCQNNDEPRKEMMNRIQRLNLALELKNREISILIGRLERRIKR